MTAKRKPSKRRSRVASGNPFAHLPSPLIGAGREARKAKAKRRRRDVSQWPWQVAS